ncbi:MAG: hypothetical protein ACRC7O_09910 [Fimbriiglobus sp.]
MFLIAQGVHRCVAAREAGLSGILAQIEADGQKSATRVIPLEVLVSPKPAIGRWDRGRDFWRLVELLGTPSGRAVIGAVFVSPVSSERAARFTRLLDVAIVDSPDEEEP